jgi:hypothetical protein
MGHVELLVGEWNDAFLAELAGFPTGAHDDMLDAAASAYNRIASGTAGMLEYYQQQIDDEGQRRLAEATAAAERAIPHDVGGVSIYSGTDWASALGSRQG